MERRVVNQLAAAHEKGFIGRGSTVQVCTLWTENSETAEIRLKVRNKGLKDFTDIENSGLKLKNLTSIFG